MLILHKLTLCFNQDSTSRPFLQTFFRKTKSNNYSQKLVIERSKGVFLNILFSIE